MELESGNPMTTPTGYRPEASGVQPPNASPAYVNTRKRAPAREPIRLVQTLSEITGPGVGWDIGPEPVPSEAADISYHNGADALGERIVVGGRVLDEDGRGIAHTLIEIWQANAAGRYDHPADQHDAPLDPHFSGIARVVTDARGGYRLTTVKPGAYPWRNHYNAWRPQHIHFSLFGPSFVTRLITQMYFPGDPLLALDPIFNSVPDEAARKRLVAVFDVDLAVPDRALGYRFDIVMRGRDATPTET
ncbi:MAG TPA: protocatechuate 3,4-dioxygenase subunit beta [Candidatus Binataceae bacterium]